MRGRVVCLVLILLIPSLAIADFTGPVVSVLDGDTIEVLHNTHPELSASAVSTALKSRSIQPFPHVPPCGFLSAVLQYASCEASMPFSISPYHSFPVIMLTLNTLTKMAKTPKVTVAQ